MKYGIIGDIHGSPLYFEMLYNMLLKEVDEIWHLGDLVDRGPSTKGVLQFCLKHKIKGVIGNHDEALLRKHILNKRPPLNKDKEKSYYEVLEVDGAVEYLLQLPKSHVIEESKSVLVHAGVNPYLPVHKQNSMACYISMCNPKEPGVSRWWGTDRKGRTEEQNREDGWERWYHLYDQPYDVYAGHMTVKNPLRLEFKKSPGKFLTYLDTGANYTGMLSAAVIGPGGFEKFVSTPKLKEGNCYHTY
jgi:predicted phosphodiesterase